MGNSYWREQHYIKEWTKQVDILFLYQLQTISEEMKRRALNQEDRQLAQWASQIRLIVANANGEQVNVQLAKHQMPVAESQDVIPIPDLRILKSLRVAA